MKKYLINDNWDLEAFDDRSDLFLLVIERNLPDCSYVYKYDTDPVALKPAYNQLINQYNDTAVDGPLNICIIKVPNTTQVTNQICCADSETKGTTEEAIEAINAVLNRADCEFLESWHKAPLTEKKHKKRRKQPYDSISHTTGFPELDINFFNNSFGTGDLGDSSESDCAGDYSESLLEAAGEEEKKPKRYIKRYYIRPQNIFCSKKSDILRALVSDVGENNCSVYSLKALDDHDDVHLLQPSDIIYYYDDGILYDKNHVKVMDYDLNVKHEEERPRFDPDTATDSKFDDAYEDRLTEALKEDADERCIICGEEFEGYGNNPDPVTTEGRCCDACNTKFVIPARIEALYGNKAQ
jgi:hypothetical protein